MSQTQLVQYPDALAYQWTGSMVGRDVGMRHQKLHEQNWSNQNAQQQAENQRQQAFDQQAMQQQAIATRRQEEAHRQAMQQSQQEQQRKLQREQTISGLAGSMGGLRRMGGSSAFRRSLLD